MQTILGDFRIFTDTGYCPGAFGLIFIVGLLNSSFTGSFTHIFVSLQENIFNLSV